MLELLDRPAWRSAGGRLELPDTLPGWTVAYLALQPDWVLREHLCALLWPDTAAREVQHNLRVNLYRVRALLRQWGVGQMLHAERSRVRLLLPTDVHDYRKALDRVANGEEPTIERKVLLSGISLAGFAGLREWVEAERSALHAAWRAAMQARLDGVDPARALVLCQALLDADPWDEEALAQQLRCLAGLGRRVQAQRLFGQFKERLLREMGAAPTPALAAAAASLPDPAEISIAAPPRDAFVGREIELAQLETMLGTGGGRIVTLTGPGGVGKSRIARELTDRMASRWRDGVAWVTLADLGNAEAALPRLAAQIGLKLLQQRDAESQIAAALATHAGLIVLDNAEHLEDLPPLLAALQAASPQAAWLVTSRQPLALAAERVYALDGMLRPQPDEVVAGVEDALNFDALRLLHARLCARLPAFDMSARWRQCLDLVRITGGWPLAIELAAGALVDHDIEAVLTELQLSLEPLAASRAPPHSRHDSMRTSLTLSWRLLRSEEQAGLARLSVFRGSFSRSAAQAVAACSGSVLTRLIERSLLQLPGGGRLELHPLVAHFAAEQLARDGAERKTAERLHCEHYAERLKACATLPTEGLAAALNEIEADFENHRRAWTMLIEFGQVGALASAARAWTEFGNSKGRTRELLSLVAAALPASVAHAAARSALLQAVAALHYRAGELDAAAALAGEALAAAGEAGDDAGQRQMLNTWALALKDLGRYEEAEQRAQEGLRRARESQSERDIASLANTCAILAKMRGEFATAAALYEESIALQRRSLNHRGLAMGLNNLGNVHLALSDHARARSCFEECLRTSERHGIASSRAFALVNLSQVHLRSGNGPLALSYAERAQAEPAAEIAVLLAADVVTAQVAIEAGDFERARSALSVQARRARQTGLHAALLETVACHARLLAAVGRRGEAIERWLFLRDHPLLPGMERGDIDLTLGQLAPSRYELASAAVVATRLELEMLIDEAIAAPTAQAARGATDGNVAMQSE